MTTMSERGSFVTEWCYCDACFDAVWSVLSAPQLKNGKPYRVRDIRPLNLRDLRKGVNVIAGRISDNELLDMESYYGPQIAALLCEGHHVRIAVLSDSSGDCIFKIHATGEIVPFRGWDEKGYTRCTT